MKISNILPITTKNIFQNKSVIPAFKGLTDVPSDTFIKEAHGKKGETSFDEKYKPYKEELTDYIINTEHLATPKIESILQKYSPETTLKNDTALSKNKSLFLYESFTHKNGKLSLDGDSLKIELVPMSIEIPEAENYEDSTLKRAKYLDMLLHESSHIFQEESSDRKKLTDIYNSYLSNPQKDTKKVMTTVNNINTLFSDVELKMIQTLYSKVKIEFPPERLSKSKGDVDKVFFDKHKMSTKTFAKNLIGNIANNKNFDKDLVLEFFKYKAENEIEAYQNALDSDKEILGISGNTDYDARIEMYSKLKEAITELQNE